MGYYRKGPYRTCPMCGGNLDPGEQCDCVLEDARAKSYWESLTQEGQYGQLVMNMEVENDKYRKGRANSDSICG